MSTYGERQDEELEVLQSIYVNDVHDLRPKKVKWKVNDLLFCVKEFSHVV